MTTSSSDSRNIWHYRLEQAESAITTLAEAAADQAEFNSAVRTWGRVALLMYGTTQAVVVGVLLYAINQIGAA